MAMDHIRNAMFYDPAGRADRLTSLARALKSMDENTERHFLAMLADAIPEDERSETESALLLIIEAIRKPLS